MSVVWARMMVGGFRISVLSNSVFLIPLSLSVYYRLWPHVVILLGVILFGTAFHANREKRLKKTDILCAWLLISSNIVLCYLGRFKQPFFSVALAFLLFSMYFYVAGKRWGGYALNHSLWHFAASGVTIACIYTYIL